MLTVTKDGFTTATRDGIVIQVADKLTLDIKMEIGVSATISIMAGAPVLETGSVSTGSVITSQQISELPLTEGTAYQLATLAPGIGYTGNPLFTGPTSNGNLAAFDQTARPVQIRSHLTVHRIMHLTAASVSHRLPMPCRSSKSRQTPSTRSKVTPPARR